MNRHRTIVALLLFTVCQAKFLRLHGLHRERRLPHIVALAREGNTSSTIPPHAHAERVWNRFTHNTKRGVEKVAKINPRQMIERDWNLVVSTLMGDKPPDFGKKYLELVVAALGILWLALYTHHCYSTYQEQEWTKYARSERKEERQRSEMGEDSDEASKLLREAYFSAPEADLVILCYNPAHDYSDNNHLLPKGALKHSFGEDMIRRLEEIKNNVRVNTPPLPRLEKFYELHQGTVSQKLAKSAKKFASSMRILEPCASPRADGDVEEEDDDEEELSSKTYHNVREALIQDLYELLPQKGFSLTTFKSMDYDELFLCVTLKNDEIVRRAIENRGLKLQIQRHVLQKLGKDRSNVVDEHQDAIGINQPDVPESSPPYILYQKHRAQNICKDFTDKDFYRTYDGPDDTETILGSLERIRAISQSITRVLNLDAAVKYGLISAWFPAHSCDGVFNFEKHWFRWGLITDLSFAQPITSIREYFGARLAFTFAWNGCYCKLLVGVIPVSFTFELIEFVAMKYGENPYWNRRSLLGLSIIFAVWTRLAMNLWTKQQQFLVSLWDLKGLDRDASKRHQFFGSMAPSPIDHNVLIKSYPTRWLLLRKAASWLITILFCVFDAFLVMGFIDSWDGRMNMGASVVLAILIQMMALVYNCMCEYLTDFENHELHLDYQHSYFYKLFIFQFINQYSAFLYIAVKQQFTPTGCPTLDGYENDCVGLLNEQLPMTLVVLTFSRVIEIILAEFRPKILVWYELFQMRRNNIESGHMSFLEQQAKYKPFRVREETEITVSLALTLGYLLIFGPIAPIISWLTLLVFIVQLRGGARLVTTAARRTLPRKVSGIGPLGDAVHFLSCFAMLFTGYMLVNFGPMFDGCSVLTRLTGLLFWCLAIYWIWCLVDLFVTPTTLRADLLDDRRNYVREQIVRENSIAEHGKIGGSMSVGVTVEYADEVEKANWVDIPRLMDKGKLKGKVSARTLSEDVLEMGI